MAAVHGILTRMKSMSVRNLLCLLLLPLAFAGCQSTPTRYSTTTTTRIEAPQQEDPIEVLIAQKQYQQAASLLEAEAEQSFDPEQQTQIRFKAARLYALAEDAPALLRLIGAFDVSRLSAENQWQLRLLQARWHLIRREPLLALARLNAGRPSYMSPFLDLYSASTRSQALVQLQDGISAVLALSDLNSTLEPELMDIWLQEMSALVRNRDVFWLTPPQALPPAAQGWVELGEIARQLWADESALDQALNTWSQRYIRHPGRQLADELRNEALAVMQSAPRHIGLLLPLSGPLGEVGQAVRDGFIAAYIDAKEQRLTVSVFDTEAMSGAAAFDAAVAVGADLIVGPLRKKQVAEVAAANAFAMPHLALNATPNTASPRPWQLSLALPPEDDAKAAARLALLHGHSQLIALRGPGAWTERSTRALSEELTQGDGALIDEMAFQSDSKSYPDAIKTLLQLERSQDRAARVQHALGQSIHYELERRPDADALYLAADVTDARQIRPQIRFYQGSDLPIYASGRLFNGDLSQQERDLNGVYFCSSPWLLGSTEGWRAQRQKFADLLNHADSSWARFHAVGHDAYQLATRVRSGGWPEGLTIAGASGELTISGNQIQRRLPCAVYRQGAPELVATP